MNKPKAQGTAWETAFVNQALEAGLLAGRMPEGGMNDVGDVWINDLPRSKQISTLYGSVDIAVVAWSRLVKPSTGTRRIADGARSVVVLDTDDFLRLAGDVNGSDFAFVVECKATERLNVTRVLDQARRKLARWKER